MEVNGGILLVLETDLYSVTEKIFKQESCSCNNKGYEFKLFCAREDLLLLFLALLSHEE